jgi:acetoin utilization deacetylase AcuC-like enzyme
MPLPIGTLWPDYANVLSHVLAQIEAFKPDAVVISLGLDTFERDPISAVPPAQRDFFTLGAALGGMTFRP